MTIFTRRYPTRCQSPTDKEHVEKIRADASEMLGLHAILRHYIEIFASQFSCVQAAVDALFVPAARSWTMCWT